MGKEMNIHLVLTFHWYDLILAGEKRTEYRKLKLYWKKRIWDLKDTAKTVTFSRGYTNTVATYEITKIDIGACPYKHWDNSYYRIHFEKQEA